MEINSIGFSNPIIKNIKQLKKKSDQKLVVLEDLSFFDFLMKESKKLKTFIYAKELINKDSTQKIVDYFIKNSSECYEVSSKVYLDIVEKGNSAGLLGVYEDKVLSISDLNPSKHHFIVVLDHLENPGNIGTLFRTCDGCGVDAIILVDEIVKSTSYKVAQTSRGMSLFMDKVSCSYEEAKQYLLKNNYDLYLGEPIKGKDYKQYDYANNIALIIGNERYGINSDWYNNKHLEVFIPMVGKMTSLNVSVAGSVLIYEAFMKRNRK